MRRRAGGLLPIEHNDGANHAQADLIAMEPARGLPPVGVESRELSPIVHNRRLRMTREPSAVLHPPGGAGGGADAVPQADGPGRGMAPPIRVLLGAKALRP
jgi:hypothetical protein